MRKLILLACAGCAAIAWACDSSSTGDGGTDATSEQPLDICSTFTSTGDKCAHASAILCFQDTTCEASNGCSCKKDDAGDPRWSCYTPPECKGNCPPIQDGGCDASDAAPVEASDDSGDDSGDAGTD